MSFGTDDDSGYQLSGDNPAENEAFRGIWVCSLPFRSDDKANESETAHGTQQGTNREPQNLLDQSLEEIREIMPERTSMYRDELAYGDLSHVRLTERCYV